MNLTFNREDLERELTSAATEVLETMFFTTVEGEQDGVTEVDGDRIRARLDFRGASAGRLELSMNLESAEELAANFLGSAGQYGTESDSRLVVSELANMVCGTLLSHLNKQAVFCLDAPTLMQSSEVLEGEVRKTLQLEHGLLQLAFSIESQIR
jgi:CheY-specific phosphatase CheX